MDFFGSIFDKFMAFFNSVLAIFKKPAIPENPEAEEVVNGWWDILTKAE